MTTENRRYFERLQRAREELDCRSEHCSGCVYYAYGGCELPESVSIEIAEEIQAERNGQVLEDY